MGCVAPEDVSLGSPPLLDPLISFPENLDAHQNGALSCCYSRPANGLPPAVRCVLFSGDEDCCFVEWGGPDLLSSLTHTEDVFDYLSADLPGSPVTWLEVRMTIVRLLSGQTVVSLPFLLTPDDRGAGSLRFLQHQAERHLYSWHSGLEGNFDPVVLELVLWPRYSQHLVRIGCRGTPPWSHPRTAPTDPRFFVENIVNNFK